MMANAMKNIEHGKITESKYEPVGIFGIPKV